MILPEPRPRSCATSAFRAAWLLLPLTVLLALGPAGCSTPRNAPAGSAQTASTGSAIDRVPPKDRVLHLYRAGLAALRRGDIETAKKQFDEAIVIIGGIRTGDSSARRSRGMFGQESRKTFLGEPYERIMAYYYRAILYWMDGERDNARACYKTAQLLESDPEQRSFNNDFVLLDYLEGFATAKLGGDASDALKRAQAVPRKPGPGPFNPKANLLLFAEYGTGPTKYAAGEYGEKLRFHPGRSQATGIQVRYGKTLSSAPTMDDITFQATTRGGRVMDHVLANKAVFKKSTDTASDVAIISGAVLATQQGRKSAVDEVGLGLLAAGIIGKIISASTTPAADVRAWDNLPNCLSFVALELPIGQHHLTVEFVDSQGRAIAGAGKAYQVNVADPARDIVIFATDRNP